MNSYVQAREKVPEPPLGRPLPLVTVSLLVG